MVMGRVRNWWNHSKTVAFIWFFSLALFYSLFQMALQNSTSPSSDSGISNNQRRSIMYDKMARDLDERGAAFLKHGETSQSLSLSDLFTLKDGSVRPVLKAVNPPVRANVLYMSTEYSVPISMFHASHHIAPVPASEVEIEAEAAAVRAVAEGLCPLEIVLDRVILTSTGVLLGCWQVISGTDPISIRAMLRTALPRAPGKQLYDAAILHTSFARLLGHPKASLMDPDNTSKQLELFHKLVTQLNNKIHGFKAVVSQLWYVEEYDVLALALNGRMKVRRFQLGCS
ncbi:PREDICTED: uncharacterized protein LOC18604656 isoform X2 [Theobroma cacao]|uniref:Uncharacterized protein LOC18604656 isoform X2 n=1 Tax=Theobroma cacao TaxID=3641 RepID=A0AB32VB19_THECC|nr:PREDICTED: uncharacterized protein LOC18604656 isoform X2 [Theobroma cacao]